MLLDWTQDPNVDAAVLEERLTKTAETMGGGRQFSATFPRMKAEGVEPHQGARLWLDALNDEVRQGYTLAGCGMVNFDYPILTGLAACQEGFVPAWNAEDYYDITLVEKGLQMNILPMPDETRGSYFRRIVNGGKYKWALHSYCREKYNIPDDQWFTTHSVKSDCRLAGRVLHSQLVSGGLL